MDEKLEAQNTVNGYVFGAKSDVELAKQELNAVKYIDKKLENKNASTILSVYNASIDKKMFRTPIGYSYLHELQKRMLKENVDAASIRGIPLFQVYSPIEEDKPKRVIKVKKKKDKFERENQLLRFVIFGLIILIIALFVISMSGSSTTVLNYKHNLENEYATWEQELTERENAIKEKERQLEIDR